MVPFKNRLNSSARSCIRGSFNRLTVAGGRLHEAAVAGFTTVKRGLKRFSPLHYLISLLFEDFAHF
jgi:hypothetical protein